jgi:hypothetical protein
MIYEPVKRVDEFSVRNFGAALHELLLSPKQHEDWEGDQDQLYFTNGTVISDYYILEALENHMQPIFVGCGWNGEDLSDELVESSLFIGCRGPLTQTALWECGVDVPVTDDPIYELPKLFPKGAATGLALAIAGFEQKIGYSKDDVFELKADKLLSSGVTKRREMILMIEMISGSRFVLSGSLSAAIVADAYKSTFAVMDPRTDDSRARWEDWFQAANLGEVIFVEDVFDGREWYNDCARSRENE